MRIRCQRKVTFIGILVLLSLFLCCTASAAGVFAGGDGTAENPYQITTVEQLIAVNDELDVCYILMNDLDLSGIANWEPIGRIDTYYNFDDALPFTGVFDGNGHIISNITIDESVPSIAGTGESYHFRGGLFGQIQDAEIRRLGIENASYTVKITADCENSQYASVGGIVGVAKNSQIDQCYFSGDISCFADYPDINLYDTRHDIGGIAGLISLCTISNCYSQGNLTGGTYSVSQNDFANVYVGGIAGSMSSGSGTLVSECYTIASITLSRQEGVSSSSYCYAGGICGSAGISRDFVNIRNCIAMPTNLNATGHNCYNNQIGEKVTVENCYFLSPNSESAKSQSYFESVGFDFLNIWTINQSYPKLKAFVNTKPTYAEQHGWCFPNSEDAFGYKKDVTELGMSTFFEMYGFYISNIFEGYDTIHHACHTKFSGFCHGMTLLSLAQYYDRLDMHSIFNSSQPNLYDFGRDPDIFTNESGNQTFTIRDNQAALDLMYRAYLTQDSYDFSTCQVFKNDDHYTELLAYFSSDQAKPLMINCKNDDGSGGHSLIVTTDTKPAPSALYEGFYELTLYDPNIPAQSELLSSPSTSYTADQRRLLVNPETTEWKIVAGNTMKYEGKYRMNIGGGIGEWGWGTAAVRFFDIEALGDSFFTFKNLKLTPFDYELQLISRDCYIIDEETNELLFRIENNQINELAEDCAYRKWINDTLTEDSFHYSFYTNRNSHLKIISQDASVLSISGLHIMSASTDSSHDIILDFENGTIIANGQNSAGEISMFIQEISSGKAIAVTAPSKADASVALSIKDGEAMTSNYSILNPEFQFDKVSSSSIPQHILTEVPAKPSTCTEHGNIAYLYCEHCDHLFTDVITQTETTIGEVTLPLLPHSGGQANCISPAVCSMCGTPYGETDPNLHTGETELRNQKEPTESESGYSGDIHCSGCQVMLEAGAEIPSLSIESTPTPTPTSTPTPTPTPTPTLTPTPTPSIEETVSPAPFSNEIPPKAGDHTPLGFIMLVTACAALSLTIIGTSHYYKRKT